VVQHSLVVPLVVVLVDSNFFQLIFKGKKILKKNVKREFYIP
jgi:hypothetical protein